ncbi:MAG: ABC transporter ATP-binding protein [Ruminococcaceae bacterium]|nr:ABC transporter ATP-binding protein [Oscillospiraceae bacterium]
MIEIKNITKIFGNVRSLNGVSAEVPAGSVFGLIGSNGSGKSTLLRIMCGVFEGDEGEVLYDGENVIENTSVKEQIVYLSDEQFFTSGGTIFEMHELYRSVYPSFSTKRYKELLELFGLDERRKVNTFSKGMQKQASLLLGLSCQPKYLFLDETFDGLDPVMRQLVKRLLAEDVYERSLTVVIASHNLRELEDICDHVGMLHRGEILFVRELDDMKLATQKVQMILPVSITKEDIPELDIISMKKQGSLYTVIAAGTEEEIGKKLMHLDPSFLEFVPLTLEEIFITEMEGRGYDYSELIL